jgi:hypothetical protein
MVLVVVAAAAEEAEAEEERRNARRDFDSVWRVSVCARARARVRLSPSVLFPRARCLSLSLSLSRLLALLLSVRADHDVEESTTQPELRADRAEAITPRVVFSRCENEGKNEVDDERDTSLAPRRR